MTNLMTHQEVIDGLTGTVPVGEGQYTGLNVELSRFTILMFYD
jgi:hypothetical protein